MGRLGMYGSVPDIEVDAVRAGLVGVSYLQ